MTVPSRTTQPPRREVTVSESEPDRGRSSLGCSSASDNRLLPRFQRSVEWGRRITSWKELSGRDFGGEQHQNGDFRRVLKSGLRKLKPWSKAAQDDLEVESLIAIDEFGRPVLDREKKEWSFRGTRPYDQVAPRVPLAALLGEGMHSIVWRAKRPDTGRQFAVKCLHTSALSRREWELARMLWQRPHPSIVELFSLQEYPSFELQVFVMEFCSGGTLTQALSARRTDAERIGQTYAPPPSAWRWTAEIFLGLEHIHLRIGSLLRDLTPECVLLTQARSAKLTDFGCARPEPQSDGQWSFGLPMGTPGYVAPEVLHEKPYDHRADLYSLGVLIWVVLTGGFWGYKEPRPPVAVPQHPLDFKAHADDWSLLRSSMNEPELQPGTCQQEQRAPSRTSVSGLLDPERDLVDRLTRFKPEERPSHHDFRRHPALLPERLPRFDCSPEELDEWVRRGRSAR